MPSFWIHLIFSSLNKLLLFFTLPKSFNDANAIQDGKSSSAIAMSEWNSEEQTIVIDNRQFCCYKMLDSFNGQSCLPPAFVDQNSFEVGVRHHLITLDPSRLFLFADYFNLLFRLKTTWFTSICLPGSLWSKITKFCLTYKICKILEPVT